MLRWLLSMTRFEPRRGVEQIRAAPVGTRAPRKRARGFAAVHFKVEHVLRGAIEVTHLGKKLPRCDLLPSSHGLTTSLKFAVTDNVTAMIHFNGIGGARKQITVRNHRPVGHRINGRPHRVVNVAPGVFSDATARPEGPNASAGAFANPLVSFCGEIFFLHWPCRRCSQWCCRRHPSRRGGGKRQGWGKF